MTAKPSFSSAILLMLVLAFAPAPLAVAQDATGNRLVADFVAAERAGSLTLWNEFLDRYGSHTGNTMVALAVKRRNALITEQDEKQRASQRGPWLKTQSDNPTGPLELTPDERKLVQRALAYAGYYAGIPNGHFGPDTLEAISKARQQAGLEPGSHVDKALLLVLPDVPAIDRLKSRFARSYAGAVFPDAMEPRLEKALAALGNRPVVFDYFQGHLYIAGMARGFEQGWYNLNELARLAGGHLVTITTPAENEFVYYLFERDKRFTLPDADGFQQGPLIGLFQHDNTTGAKGRWAWVTGEPLDYTNWADGRPDVGDGRQNYGRFFRDREPPNGDPRAIFWTDSAGSGNGFVMEVD